MSDINPSKVSRNNSSVLIYIKCVDCGKEFRGNPNKTFKEWLSHRGVCQPTILSDDKWWILHNEALERDGYACSECGSKKELEIHHIKPHAKGGADTLTNLITLCKKCHRSKTNELMNALWEEGYFEREK